WLEAPKETPTLFMTVPLPGNRLLATDYEVECFQPLRPGDRVFKSEKLMSIVPRTFRVGVGHHVTVKAFFRNQHGEVCITDSRTIFRYKFGAGAGYQPAA